MNLTLANPMGLWALAGIPAVLLIHFLQRETRVVVISTLFLLDQLPQESVQGRRFDRLRQSVPLWLQLLAVAVLTWVLVQPHWLRRDSAQRVTLILDSSASMSAFQPRVLTLLDQTIARLSAAAARTEWVVVETDMTRGTVFSGSDAIALREALRQWRPLSGSHDFTPALAAAQSHAGATTTIILVTDHLRELPEGIHLLAAGAPLANCGFAGVRVWDEGGETRWRALVRNYSAEPQERQWWLESGAEKTAPDVLRLQPDQMLAIGGRFPAGAINCVLAMTDDAFGLDDRLPMVAPEPKVLLVRFPDDEVFRAAFQRAVESLPAVAQAPGAGPVDLEFVAGGAASAPAAVLYETTVARGKPLPGDVVVENHPLVEGLSWQGLLIGPAPSEQTVLATGDTPLLWQGRQPLLVLSRNHAGAAQLRFLFNPAQSNMVRLPAFVVLLHRFAEQIRAIKPAMETANVQTRQLLPIAVLPDAGPIALRAAGIELRRLAVPGDVVTLRAPDESGFFEVAQGGVLLFRGAAQFAEPREADLRLAASKDDLDARSREITLINSRRDPMTSVWLLGLLGVCAGSWGLTGRRKG